MHWTRTTPARRMTLQFLQMTFTDALTFTTFTLRGTLFPSPHGKAARSLSPGSLPIGRARTRGGWSLFAFSNFLADS